MAKLKHFRKCKSREDAEKLYRKLAMEFHPDKGGSDEDFREMNEEYKNFVIAIDLLPEISVPAKLPKVKYKIPDRQKEKLIASAGEFAQSVAETAMTELIRKYFA